MLPESKTPQRPSSFAGRAWRWWRKFSLAVGAFVARGVITVGAVLVQLLFRVGKKHHSATGWVAGSSSVVSISSYTSSRYVPSAAQRRRAFAVTVLCVAGIDLTAGTISRPEYQIPQRERLESAPGVKPGDIEYAVQRDAEKLYLDPKTNGRWTITQASSETINWSDATGRRTTNSESYGANTVRVSVVGGSAAFGFGQADTETIASRLSEEMQQDGYDVHVLNYGMMGYTAWQAAADIEYRASRGERFDVVVAYVGFNDVALGFYQRRVPESVIKNTESADTGVAAWVGNHSMVARLLGRSPVLRKPVIRRRSDIDNHGASDSRGTAGSDVQANGLYNLAHGYSKLRSASQKYKFELVFVLQPNWFESDLTRVDESAADVDLFRRDMLRASWADVRRTFSEKMHDVPGFVDAGRVLDYQTCWLDLAHTRGECSYMLVAAMKTAVEDAVARSGQS